MDGFRNIKKRQTKPDLLISSVFSKHDPPMNNFFVKKNHLQDSTNSWTKPESLTTAKKFLFKERKLPNTKQHTKSDVLQLFSKTLFKPVPPERKRCFLILQKTINFCKKTWIIHDDKFSHDLKLLLTLPLFLLFQPERGGTRTI